MWFFSFCQSVSFGVTVEPLSTTQGVQIGLGGAGVDMKINK